MPRAMPVAPACPKGIAPHGPQSARSSAAEPESTHVLSPLSRTAPSIALPIAPRQRPAFAATNDYGGYDILTEVEPDGPDYGRAAGWSVRQVRLNGRIAYCYAESNVDDHVLRIGYDRPPGGGPGQWQLAIPMNAAPDWEGTIGADGDDRPSSATSNGPWTIAWFTVSDLWRLAEGSVGRLTVDGVEFTFSTDGMIAASAAVADCTGTEPPLE